MGRNRRTILRALAGSLTVLVVGALWVAPAGVAQDASRADRAAPRADRNSQIAHEQLLEKAKRGGIDVYFVGDSITRRWGCSDPQYVDLLANWKANFFGWNAGDF